MQIQEDISMGTSSWYGEAEILKFRDGKLGAYSMQFDDSRLSQANIMIPHLNWRGLVATFFINPGNRNYENTKYTWEIICPKFGHELANHTMHHKGAKDYEEADYEIGECSRHIWKIQRRKSKLLPFQRGGGTTWGVTEEQIEEIMSRYFLFVRPSMGSMRDDIGTGFKMPSYPQRAMDEKTAIYVHFHGIGDGNLSVTEQYFVELLDYLAANRDKLWVGTTSEIFKYCQEYEALSDVSITDAQEGSFRTVVECDAEKVNLFGAAFVELYDEPLTVRNEVPRGWSAFFVRQGKEVRSYPVTEFGGKVYAQYNVKPNVGEAMITRI
jgi:hypothetical protein